MNYLSQVNANSLYLMVGGIIGFVLLMCLFFLIRSYKAGIAIGMDKKILQKTIRNSAIFTILPSVGILVGVIALSGALGAPLSWMRLSVVGALQYELNVADIAAKAIGLSGLNVSEMSVGAFATVSLVMTVGILGGGLCCIFFLGKYLGKLGGKKKSPAPENTEQGPKKGSNIGNIAMVAMFIGLCTAYISSYIGAFANDVTKFLPLLTACVAALVMFIFTALSKNPRFKWVENFDVALSMLIAMAAAVIAGGAI